MRWTAEQIATLRKMHSESASGPEIACAIGGGISPHAVYGQLFRLGLSVPRELRRVVRGRAAGNAGAIGSKLSHARFKKNDGPPMKPTPVPKPTRFDSLDLTFDEIGDGQCRYIVTEDSPFLYCGQPQKHESSYCRAHHDLCHSGRALMAIEVLVTKTTRRAA